MGYNRGNRLHPGRTEKMSGRQHASPKAAPEKSGAVPPSWPFGGPASCPADGCAAYAFLHNAPAEPQLSMPSQMGDVPLRL